MWEGVRRLRKKLADAGIAELKGLEAKVEEYKSGNSGLPDAATGRE